MLQLNFQPFPVIETERLHLREMTIDDAQPLFNIRSDERVMKYIGRPLAKTIEDAAQLIRSMAEMAEKNDGITWAISLKNDPQLIGTMGYYRTEHENYRSEIGYLLHPQYWKMGIVTEAIVSAIQYGFQHMGLHSIAATLHPDNIASVKTLEKQGFIKEAHFKENFFFNGNFGDTAVYSLLKSACKQ